MNIPTGHNLFKPNPGLSPNKDDFHVIEWGRETNTGFVIGRSSSPAFFTADGHNVHLEDCARGSSIMIMFDNASTSISYNGVHTWCVGNSINHCKPSLWTTFHNPDQYDSNIWMTPTIIKIMPLHASYKSMRNGQRTANAPFTFYFRRHTSFNASSFFSEETVWHDGSMDTEIISIIKLASLFGYRNIYLNGCNFKENVKTIRYLRNLEPFLSKNHINIYDCNDNGVFEYISPDEASKKCILV